MSDRRNLAFVGALAVAIGVGWVARGPIAPALAGEPLDPVVAPPPAPERFVCRAFPVALDHGAAVDTSDRTTEIGQWVGPRTDEGWRVTGVDFEVGQKNTGYSQGYVQVCVASPR